MLVSKANFKWVGTKTQHVFDESKSNEPDSAGNMKAEGWKGEDGMLHFWTRGLGFKK